MKKLLSICLIAVLALSTVACGTKTSEQNTKKRIGILQLVAHPALDNVSQGIIDGLAELGITADNTIIDLQNANGDATLANTIAQKFVNDKCDIIVAVATVAAQAAYNATRGTDIPIIFSAVSDPLEAGLVQSMEKPNSNVTGISDSLDVAASLQLVKALLPDAQTVGVIYNSGEANSVSDVAKLKNEADKLGYKVETKTVSATADIPMAMDAILSKVDVIVNTLDNTIVSAMSTEISKADAKNIPIIGSESGQVENGALVSNGFDYYDVGTETAPIIGKVLKGTSPNEIPIGYCTKTKMYINAKKAAKYNAAIPEGAAIIGRTQ